MNDRFEVGVASSIGIGASRGGRSINEDNFLICQDGLVRFREGRTDRRMPVEGHGLLVAVADGMGGHESGEVASTAAVRALSYLYRLGSDASAEVSLRLYLLHAHTTLRARAQARGPVNMGTTLTVGWVLEGALYWAHVGDSRVYLARPDALQQLSRDHNRGEFASRDGRPPPRDPSALCQGFVFGSRGFGDDDSIRIDLGKDTGCVPLQVGDRLLFCSDGLYNHIPLDRLHRALLDAEDPNTLAESLVEQAMAGGSDDNITALILVVRELADRGNQPEPVGAVKLDTLVPDDL